MGSSLRVVAVMGGVLLASCATQDLPTSGSNADQATGAVPVTDGSSAKEQRIASQPLKYLAGRKLRPIPDKELDVRTRCSFKDVQGGRGSMDLQVAKAEVQRFVAEVTIPKQGVCRFNMSDFTQTVKMPTIVLNDLKSACTVRMWEQENGVTVSFNACQTRCSGDAFSYLWPILVNKRNGRCS